METLWRLAALFLAVSLLVGCTNDVIDASYPTTADAVASGAVKRGWIPAWLPSTAKDLREVHDVDTNQSALSFTLQDTISWRPPALCRSASGGEFSEPPFSRVWIPSPQELSDAYDFYSCPSALAGPMLEAVAVQRAGKHVLHWRVLAR
jgi:hypothetical protein